jgi:hypothetical protein
MKNPTGRIHASYFSRFFLIILQVMSLIQQLRQALRRGKPPVDTGKAGINYKL